RVSHRQKNRLAQRKVPGRSDADWRVGRDQGHRGQVGARTPQKHKRRRLSESAANLFGGRPPKCATHAVTGTLRPTERRRAAFVCKKAVELRGIEPLTSAVRLQRSPS